MKLVDLFRPNWKNSNKQKRLTAVQDISDQAILSKIALKDDNSDVRSAAIGKITNQKLLIEIINNSKDVLIRKAAIEKIIDQSVLSDIAMNNKHFNDRITAINKVTDMNLIHLIFTNDKNEDVRFAANKKLINEREIQESLEKKRKLISSLCSDLSEVKKAALDEIIILKDNSFDSVLKELFHTKRIDIETYFTYLSSLDNVTNISFLKQFMVDEWYNLSPLNPAKIALQLEKIGWFPNEDESSLIYYIIRKDWNKINSIGEIAIIFLFNLYQKNPYYFHFYEFLNFCTKEVAVKYSLLALQIAKDDELRFVQILDRHKFIPSDDQGSIHYLVEKNLWDQIRKIGSKTISVLIIEYKKRNNYSCSAIGGLYKTEIANLLVEFGEIQSKKCPRCTSVIPIGASVPGYCPYCNVKWINNPNQIEKRPTQGSSEW